MRRFRLTFAKGEEVRYISHLDLLRTLERTFRRARLQLTHSQGFNPRPRVVFAAPLPVGTSSDAELVDVSIEDDLDAADVAARIRAAAPPGIAVKEVVEVAADGPPLMAQAASADYLLDVLPPDGEVAPDSAQVAAAITRCLAAPSLPYERRRKGTVRPADMRPAVLGLWVAEDGRVGMHLRLDSEGQAVRPEEVLQVLLPGWRASRVHRTAIHLKPGQVAADAA